MASNKEARAARLRAVHRPLKFFSFRPRATGSAETPLSVEDRLALFRQHGNFAIAYSVAMQPGLRHFGDARGFLSFTKVGGTAFVLADPIAPFELWGDLIDRFVARERDVGFWQASRRLADLLSGKGFMVNEFGCVTALDLRSYSFAGPDRRSFRTARNRMQASGRTIREVSLGEVGPAKLEAISDGWRKTKVTARRELSFLVRPIVLADEPGVRKFILFGNDGEPEAFAFFDPVCSGGRVTGYLSATRRWLPSADPLSAYALVGAAIERFKAEGIEQLHLGLSPFARVKKSGYEHKNWLTKRAFRFLYTNRLANRFVYPAQSLARHKASYGGHEELSYYAFNTLPSLPRLLKVLRACGLI